VILTVCAHNSDHPEIKTKANKKNKHFRFISFSTIADFNAADHYVYFSDFAY